MGTVDTLHPDGSQSALEAWTWGLAQEMGAWVQALQAQYGEVQLYLKSGVWVSREGPTAYRCDLGLKSQDGHKNSTSPSSA